MKKYIVLTLFIIISFHLAAQRFQSFPQVTRAGKGIVNTRVDNMVYWKRMIDLGFVNPDPYIPVAKPVFTGSMIRGGRMASQDSPDIPVTDDPDATQSENSVFADPNDGTVLLNSNNSTNWVNNYVENTYGADWFVSVNSGTSWTGSKEGAGGKNTGDPASAIGLNGRWYVGNITNSLGQEISYSTSQGTTWTTVEIATVPATGNDLLDKNHLWVDTKEGSPYANYLYDAWTNMVGSSPNNYDIEFTRSANNGQNWSTPLNISQAVNAGSHNQGVNIHSGPNGEVYAVWTIYDSWPADENALGFAKSIDGGAVFTPATRIIDNIKGIRTSGTSKNMRVNSFPSMTVDVSSSEFNGNIYVVWPNYGYPGENTGSDIDVYLIRSTDGGNTWSTPIRVNQDPAGLGKEHFFPWITCDPVTGTLAVIYYDDRNVSTTQCETWVSYSHDGGLTWEDVKVSDVAFTPEPIAGLAMSYFGDYLGITSDNMMVYPVWTDNRTGRALTYTSPFTLGPAPNQPYIVFNSYTLEPVSDLPSQTLNFGDSLHLSLGIKNIGDQPASNLVATLSTTNYFITVTDSTEGYGTLAPGETRVIPNGYAIKVSDTIPDGTKVKFDLRVTDGDSTWLSHFSIEAHAPALKLTTLTVNDTGSGANSNGRLDPGETADILVMVSNTGDFSCPNTLSLLTTSSDYLVINSGSFTMDTLRPGQSSYASFNVTAAEDANIGSVAEVMVTSASGLYHVSKNYRLGIGQIVEDWETNTFTKFPWQNDATHPWVLTNIQPYEGQYCSRSGGIQDLQFTNLILNWHSGADDSISFYRKTSSEPGYDFLSFFIDNVFQGKWAGEIDWGRAAFPVSAGSHNFLWSYQKDVYYAGGQDQVWTDFIVLPAPPLPQINTGPDDTICEGMIYQIQVSAADYDSLQWTTSGDGIFSNDAILSPQYSPGTLDIINGSVKLKLTGYGPYGNVRKSMDLTIGNLPVAAISVWPKDTVCADHTITLSVESQAGWSVLWTPGNFTSPEIQVDTSVTGGINTTQFTVTVTNIFHCARSDSATVTFRDCTGIEEKTSLFEAEAYPNPTNGDFTLSIWSREKDKLDITLVNPLNVQVFKESGIPVYGKFSRNFNLKHLPPGVYLLEIVRGDGSRTMMKLIIRK